MAISHIWNVVDLERDTSDGFVFKARWTLSANDGTYNAMISGLQGFPEKHDNLIPYESLTEDIVLGWIKDDLGEDTVTGLENSLSKQIEEFYKPTEESGVPW